ncbi:hypothetical protein LJB92_01405 [Bacteroidales bacterium OttesenSCG-928-M06]|nr:hypothetical protein [Bacteroidales bacterium OttesenSCG-928-M06]
MDFATYLTATFLLFPVVSSFFCLLFIFFLFLEKHDKRERKLQLVVSLFYLFVMGGYLFLLFYQKYPGGLLTSISLLVVVAEIALLYYASTHSCPSPEHSLVLPSEVIPEAECKLTKRGLDQFFRSQKPYLDPKCNLTDLAMELSVSREALSQFINRNYRVNFNVYVNRWRLKELERLKKKTENENVTLMNLLPMAGFGSYHSYMRAKKE